MADVEVMRFPESDGSDNRQPRSLYGMGTEPDPLYTLANERTYVAWLRLGVTILAGAIAIDRLFLQQRNDVSRLLAVVLVLIAIGCTALGAHRWWATERALRLRRPLPGFGPAALGTLSVVLLASGVTVAIMAFG